MASADLKFINDSLAAHNDYRARHGAAPLKNSSQLNKSAQEWAEQLVSKDKLENSPKSDKDSVGENISMRSSSGKFVDITGKGVTDQWYEDIKGYDFKTGIGKAGNFTQLVWAGTQEFGIGKAHKDGKCIVVAHYKPAGNVRGQNLENVKPASGEHLPPSSHGVSGDDSGAVKSKTTVVTETKTDPKGQVYTVKKEITETTDELGNITQKIKETKITETAPVADHQNDDISDEDHPADKDKDPTLVKFIHDTISAHNSNRKLHGSPSLKHNRDLDALAQKAAETLASQAHLSNINHTYKSQSLGENIASRWSNGPCDYDGAEVVDHWYQEGKAYKYDVEPGNVQGIGNFTQLVWKGSKEIGVGKAFHSSSDGTKVIVVCHYYPSGNILKCFKDNVPPKSK